MTLTDKKGAKKNNYKVFFSGVEYLKAIENLLMLICNIFLEFLHVPDTFAYR